MIYNSYNWLSRDLIFLYLSVKNLITSGLMKLLGYTQILAYITNEEPQIEILFLWLEYIPDYKDYNISIVYSLIIYSAAAVLIRWNKPHQQHPIRTTGY